MFCTGAEPYPDGYAFSTRWWQFRLGTYPEQVNIQSPQSLQIEMRILKDAIGGRTSHLIFEATDQETTVLTRYQRIKITV